MNHMLMISILSNLLKTNVLCYQEPKNLMDFETRYCLHTGLQPMFQASVMQMLVDSMAENVIYEVTDSMEVGLALFIFDKQKYILGPYAKLPHDEQRMQNLLVKVKLPASFAMTANLYCSGLQVLPSYKVVDTISAITAAFAPGQVPYTFRRLSGLPEMEQEVSSSLMKEIDYRDIYKRYDLENIFMDMITEGRVKAVEEAFKDMRFSGAGVLSEKSAYAYRSLNGITIIRVLARKAAERSGLSVIIIDEITQRAVQQLGASMSFDGAYEITIKMILELTQAVHDHLLNKGAYSPLISKVTEHLMLNYTQECSLSQIAEKNHVSDAYLSRQFKKETGKTLTGYITELRCREAANLLRGSTMSIADISLYVGYPDNNYFVKVFKKEYGMTPSLYRSQPSAPGAASKER